MTDSKEPKTEKPNFPHVGLPLKAKSKDKNTLQHYFSRLAGDADSRFLFNRQGLWHQGIHLRADKFHSSDYEHKICAIADGKLIAYKVDSEYKSDSEHAQSAVYSTGFFLLEHELEYPKGNKLTFYSLYRHTAKLSDYKSTVSMLIGEVQSADKTPVMIRDRNNRSLGKSLADGTTILVRKTHNSKEKYDELVWYKDRQGKAHKPEAGEWRIYRNSYQIMQEEEVRGIPLLAKNNVKTQSDIEVKLPAPIQVKAGEELGLMGEYNQAGESQQKLLHLEVFSYDDIEAFRAKAKGAYAQDKGNKRLTDNFLYVARGSQLYSVMNDEAYEFDTTSIEIMVPLSEVNKVTIGKEKNKKDYYDVAPYLNNHPEKSEAKIYVDNSHLTHGVLLPGVNVFNQSSNSLCIFKAELHEWCDPNSRLSQVEKDRLDPMFSAVLGELDLDKDRPTEFKAGKLNQISLSPSQHRRMTGIIAKHDNEWKTTRINDFEKMLALYRHHGKAEQASRLEKRIKDLAISLKVNHFDTEKPAYYMHPLGMVGWLAVAGCQCGNKLINQIKCTRYGKAYGPVYWGNKKLNSYSRWDYLISTGKITQDEKTILLAMSDNEGNMDAVHSYDSEILTAGAMQKTINSSGAGELPIQMFKFKQQHPSLFDKYFKCCGWDVDNVNNKYIAYYNGMTGLKLKQFLREGCSAESYGKVVPNKALAIFAEAVIIEEYQDLQVEDFVDRLNNKALVKKPNGYSYQISSYIKSNLGKATVLDHDVNRPGYVAEDFAKALNYFYRNHPNVNKNPNTWGEKHNSYEREIIEYYGNNRRGTDMVSRFKKLKGKL